MIRKILFISSLTIFLAGCRQASKSDKTVSADESFKALSEEFIDGYLSWRPHYGVYLGFHQYDGKMTDLSKESVEGEYLRLKSFEQKFRQIDTAGLSPKMKLDRTILLSMIGNELFNFEDLQVFKYNPMVYFFPSGAFGEIGMDLSIYLNHNFAPLEERFKSIMSVLKEVPKTVSDAESNLADSLPGLYISTTIEILESSADFLKNDLVLVMKEINNDTISESFNELNESAVKSLLAFRDFLKKEKLTKATDKYAMGIKNFEKMLLCEDIMIDPEKLLQIGLKELEKEQEEFKSTAKLINPDISPVEVFEQLQHDHPTADRLIESSAANIEAIRQFVKDKNLITIPSEVRAKVKEMPKYLRSAFAIMDIPGPFETVATDANYFITPVDPQWTPKQKEEWLGLFNYYTSDIISIHEAYPGHYVNFLHLNSSNATKIEKVYMDYQFAEGWAHYSEQMMIEEEFGNSGNPVEASKYKLAQLDESLARVCRYCVSLKMHCFGMSLDEAVKFFMDNSYMGEKTAYMEAVRATYDPRYLYYTLGKLQIIKLREDFRKQEGSNFSLQKFHDQFLDHGMPPIKQMREIMLKDRNLWNEIL